MSALSVATFSSCARAAWRNNQWANTLSGVVSSTASAVAPNRSTVTGTPKARQKLKHRSSAAALLAAYTVAARRGDRIRPLGRPVRRCSTAAAPRESSWILVRAESALRQSSRLWWFLACATLALDTRRLREKARAGGQTDARVP